MQAGGKRPKMPGLMANAGMGMNMMGMGMPAAKKPKSSSTALATPKGGKGNPPGGPTPRSSCIAGPESVGEVRFESAIAANTAMETLNGAALKGSPLTLMRDRKSKDGSKIWVLNLAVGTESKEMQEHFQQAGGLAFAAITHKVRGEVRFESKEGAEAAFAMLEGSMMKEDWQISLTMDPSSKDGTKILVAGMAPDTGWQDLKDHFKQVDHPLVYAGLLEDKMFATIRYDDAETAQKAITALNQSTFKGSVINVEVAEDSADGTKLKVTGLPLGTEWQDLKDVFKTCGRVAFCEIIGGKGKGKGKGMMMMNPMMMMPPGMMMGGGGGGRGKGAGKGMMWVQVPMNPMMMMMGMQNGMFG